MYIVLLSGGSGKRLWPLTNDVRPKQYLPFLKDEHGQKQSMIQRVWGQLVRAGLSSNTIITTGNSQLEIIKNQLGKNVPVALEPERRDTFPAIALSCAYVHTHYDANDEDSVVVLPVDPYTEDSFYQRCRYMEQKMQESQCDIMLMGIAPSSPSSKYGYMIPRSHNDGYLSIDRFQEKPDKVTAQKLIEQGAMWNSGVFCFKLGFVLQRLRDQGLPDTYDELFESYNVLPKISFDFEVLEKCQNICAVEFSGAWKDLGTWNALAEEMHEQSLGNNVLSETCENTHVINELGIPVVVMGTKNLVVAAASDGILVAEKEKSSQIKEYIRNISARPMYEERRWGHLRVIDITKNDSVITMTRRVTIHCGMNLSLHRHRKHAEIWTVVSGEGQMYVDGEKAEITAGKSIYVPVDTLHTVQATKDLVVIEIQVGSVLDRDDIERVHYQWDEIQAYIKAIQTK